MNINAELGKTGPSSYAYLARCFLFQPLFKINAELNTDLCRNRRLDVFQEGLLLRILTIMIS